MGKTRALLEALGSSGKWQGYDLYRGKNTDAFKQYLRDLGIYFEPSENGEFTHFEVLVKSDEQAESVDDYIASLVSDHGYNESVLEARKQPVDKVVEKIKALVSVMSQTWGFESPEEADIRVELEEKEDAYVIWLLGEFDYETMFMLADQANQILVSTGYGESYFDAEDSGRWCAYLWKANLED